MLRNIVSNIYKNFPQKTIFVSNHHYANIVSLIALKSYKHIKIVLVDRADLKEAIGYYNLINFFKGLIIYFLVPIFYKSADAIVTNSKSAKVDLQRLCKKKVINISPPSLLKFLSKKNKKNKKKNLYSYNCWKFS